MTTAVSASRTSNVTITYQNDDGSTTVMSGGTRAWRNNNPGNLREGPFSQSQGSIGRDNDGFAIFLTWRLDAMHSRRFCKDQITRLVR